MLHQAKNSIQALENAVNCVQALLLGWVMHYIQEKAQEFCDSLQTSRTAQKVLKRSDFSVHFSRIFPSNLLRF
jgi:hypothetical protein